MKINFEAQTPRSWFKYQDLRHKNAGKRANLGGIP